MIDQLLENIREVQGDTGKTRNLAVWHSKIESLSSEQIGELLGLLVELKDEPGGTPLHQALQPIVAALIDRAQKQQEPLSPTEIAQIKLLYEAAPPSSNLRNQLLAWLATGLNGESLQAWVSLACSDPPQHRSGIGLAFGPLLDRDRPPLPGLLETLLTDGTQHLQLAPAIYDLSNFYVRSGQMDKHPATGRAKELTILLGQLVGQLGKIEEGSNDTETDPQLIGQQVADSVAVIVSLCDALALMDHKAAIGKLHQALSLKHRRVQTEAAAALSRMGDELGREALLKLAEEPVVRLRVLNYAGELGLTDEISLEQRGEIAKAESRLAIWLAEPMQMGIAPTKMHLIDNRELYWPSYEHPIQCYLFRFEYGSGERKFENLAICGPMVHAFSADIKGLSVDDAYALFAGWQTTHDEIFQMTPTKAQQVFPQECQELIQSLAENESLTECEVKMFGSFFGKIAMIVECQKNDVIGTAIVDLESTCFIEQGMPKAPIDADLAYAIWRGRQLLSSFNPP